MHSESQTSGTLAADWAAHKITVNAILPGGFMTESNQRWSKLHPDVIEHFRAKVPLGMGWTRICKAAARVCKLEKRRNSLVCSRLRSR